MNQKNNAHHRRFFVKGLIILLLLGMNYLMFSFFFSSVVEDITYDNESRRDTRLLELTSEGEYADLYEELNLYDLYEDKYDDYWDVTDAWHLYWRFAPPGKPVSLRKRKSSAPVCWNCRPTRRTGLRRRQSDGFRNW